MVSFLGKATTEANFQPMPGACFNPYGCEWSMGDLWRSMDWFRRLDVVVLVFMLAYVLAVVTRVFCRYKLVREPRGIDCAGKRKLAADLSLQARSLKSIASTAPYLGLLGTCIGIVNAPGIGSGFGMEKSRALALVASGTATALITTVAGILVAVPATCSYNYLCTRIGLLQSEVFTEPLGCRFPLRKRFSGLPAFALIAAPGLAVAVSAFMSFASFREPKGLGVEVVPARCEYEGDDRIIVLRLTNAGKLFINQTQEDWNRLPDVLAQIYGLRVHRTLYLLAEDGVPFQTVADALNIVENANVEPHQAVRTGADKLDITVRLITPKAMNTSCVLQPVAIGSRQHASR
jgi:biopolymer transport protein ExbD